MARDIALIALATLGLSDLPCHDPCHAEAAADRRDVRFGKRGCHSDEGTHQPRWTFKPVHEHEAGTRPSERLNASGPRGPKALNSLGHPENLGGHETWEDARSWRHRRSTRMSCASAR